MSVTKVTAALKKKMSRCAGCTEDFYNGHNPMGVSMCWHLPSAKMVKKVRVGINERPPWNGKPVSVFNCRHERGVCLFTPASVAASNAACLASMARDAASQDRAEGR